MVFSRWLVCGLLACMIPGVLTACRSGEPPAAALDPTPYLSPLEKEVAQEINLARTQPKAYAAFVAKLRPNYVRGQGQGVGGRAVVRSGGKTVIMTAEGPPALDEAVAFLRTQPPLPALHVSPGMSRGAKDHVLEQGRTSTISHQGRDGSQPGDRANRYGRWLDTFSENISHGLESARDMTIALIIDDGVPTRGHRKNMFHAQARWLGVACGKRQAETLCVTTFAGTYTEGTQ